MREQLIDIKNSVAKLRKNIEPMMHNKLDVIEAMVHDLARRHNVDLDSIKEKE